MEIETILVEIIKILEKEEPKNENLIQLCKNCKGGNWESKAHFRFVNPNNANQPNSEWQFQDNIIIEHNEIGTIVIDLLKNNKIGGIELLNQLK
ncbi:hypothetical protein DMB65_21530 [Flavobacterium cheongpyeongense]|uniref:Uncharacterized protein n=1 Tax=Flavobacterium cheongpyeongense TaxID=2212651 RepID=A0A2V4BXM4_9FLAO|nr:hypothetical protein [Flavobacterium cheongpyeongense]PXY38734.1 hypothetical protein DMB65_21530 [Flavobacterium cheongpyeongense]